MLLKSYIEAEKILTAACKEFPQLKTKVGDFEKHMEELKQSEFFLLVTGNLFYFDCFFSLLAERILIWCSCGTKAEIFELVRVTAD